MKNLLDLEHKLNYYFNDRSLLKNALLHKSFGNENRKYKNINNERLELLGDAVLGLIIAEYLYKYKKANEGILARIKSMVVSEPVLAKISRNLKVGEYLMMSKGEEMTGGRNRDSILGDAFEAILGAIYLDAGFEEAKNFVLNHMEKYIDHIEENEEIIDYKTLLQEYVQKHFKIFPEYQVIGESGPDHLKEFEISVRVGEHLGIAKARNKKKAEQLSAKDLCKKLGVKYNETL
ncbi:MAG: ribonuclease III [Fusobacterium gastrosuis]|uniref:ribonuclease III n=1 Tax=Fusobacterium TaxID=848 RepID=UPI0025C3F1B8|nr:ribonuclease III [Fusobacterium sp.]MCI7223851.1 ribonuclease III [Fusobacterium sp.]MDD7391491.1 ribonuclease III [Fusobacteriaceae bacterium]MDY5794383.1 ribonuclease III [Fusobacterium gastrosuis]